MDLRKNLFSQEILAPGLEVRVGATSGAPNLEHLTAEVAKILGVICACGSSLAVGPEGPMIHIGAAAGSGMGGEADATSCELGPEIRRCLSPSAVPPG